MKKLNLLFLGVSFLASNLIISQNPYASIGKKTKPMLSLSNGTYVEHFENDSIRQIGSVMINMRTEQIVAFVDRKEQSKKNHSKTSSRFLSVDPLARQFPFYTPYQYAGNTPIQAIDLDGLEQYYTQSGELIGKYGTNTEIRIVDEKYTNIAKQITTSPNSPATETINTKLYNAGTTGIFNNTDDAAKKFGELYNGKSIKNNKEYGSEIYEVNINDKTYNTFTIPDESGLVEGVNTTKAPENSNSPADIHTHGKFLGKSDNEFSDRDKEDNFKKGNVGYLVTPNGSLQKYTPSGYEQGDTEVISNDMPSTPEIPDAVIPK